MSNTARFVLTQDNGEHVEGDTPYPAGFNAHETALWLLGRTRAHSLRLWLNVDEFTPTRQLGAPHAEVTR